MFYNILFYTFASISIIMAIMSIFSKKHVYSILSLIGSLLGIIPIFILLSADFMALIFAIVYLGAIAILFLFIIIMINQKKEINRPKRSTKSIIYFISILTLIIINITLVIYNIEGNIANPANSLKNIVSHTNYTQELALKLYTEYSPLFILLGIILLIAVIGSITLVSQTNIANKKQNIYKQVNTYKKDILKLHNLKK